MHSSHVTCHTVNSVIDGHLDSCYGVAMTTISHKVRTSSSHSYVTYKQHKYITTVTRLPFLKTLSLCNTKIEIFTVVLTVKLVKLA